jgi:N-acyl-L-homoserine lactone synthetase
MRQGFGSLNRGQKIMIQMITQKNAHECRDLLHSFLELRYRVFTQRLKWMSDDLSNEEQIERDEFDNDNAEYMVVCNRQGDVVAGLRLLQTMQRHLLGDVFGHMVRGTAPRGESVREVTRFVVDPCRERTNGNDTLVLQLVWGLQTYGLMTGLSRYVSLSYIGIERILKGAGCLFHRLGDPVSIDGRLSVALEFQISDEVRDRCVKRLQFRDNGSAPSSLAFHPYPVAMGQQQAAA